MNSKLCATSAARDSSPAAKRIAVDLAKTELSGNEKREFEGFWLAIVKRIEPGEYTLEWFDAPEYPAFKIAPRNVGIVHPEFRVSGK